MLVIVLAMFIVTWLPNMVFMILRYHRIGKLLHQSYLHVLMNDETQDIVSVENVSCCFKEMLNQFHK